MEEKKGLYAKMAAVMNEVGYVKKRGHNQAQNYDYVMAADIANEVGKLLADKGLAFAPVDQSMEWETRESNRGSALFVCRLSVMYSLFDIDTGQSIQIPSFGEGMDTGDKAAYKAMTGALKYALIQTFLIAAGDDPEEEKDDGLGRVEAKPDEAQAGPKVAEPLKVMNRPRGCPVCGQAAVIKGRPEYGGGWVCYKRFGGCGEKFTDNDSRIHNGSTLRLHPEQPSLTPKAEEDVKGDSGNGSGNQKGARDRITTEQLDELKSWCVTFGVDEGAVLRQYKLRDPSVETLADLTPDMFDHASKVFASKKEKASKLN